MKPTKEQLENMRREADAWLAEVPPNDPDDAECLLALLADYEARGKALEEIREEELSYVGASGVLDIIDAVLGPREAEDG